MGHFNLNLCHLGEIEIKEMIEKFLDGKLSASEIELKILNSNLIIDGIESSIEGILTQPLIAKYHEITGKSIMHDLTKAYPPQIDRFICLLKAIENQKDVEYYYSEYWKNNIPKDAKITKVPDDAIF